MATPSGAPPNTTPTATTNSTSGDKKKLFIGLGVAGVAALGLGAYFLMNSRSGATDVAATATANTVAVTDPSASESASGAPGSTLANGGIPPTGITAVSTGSNPATLLPLSPYRRDPFQPFTINPPPPLPLPPPPPTPLPPPRPTPIPPPVEIPQIEAVDVPGIGNSPFGGGSGGGAVSPFPVPGAGTGGFGTRPLILPTVVIPRLNSTKLVPTNAFPPPRSSSGAGSGVTTPSFDKRLSGVVIGNGVRAVLEISGGATPKSYVVQPGDVVEGITILNIQRFNEGGKQVTRMLIRENGGERTVDLKPGPPRTTTGIEGGFPGQGGFPGGPGGFPGGPGGFPGGPNGFGGRPGGFGGG